ncbi:MAG: DUF2062 domain-containing protein [Panacagrimonas sp.]
MSHVVAGPAAASWWRRRLLAPVVAQLRQGTTPQRIALSVAAGVVLGIFPILGATTLLCALVAAGFRLNQPVIQAVNYLIYPAQIALLFPFYRLGEKLFRQPPVPIASLSALIERFWAGPQQFFIDYGMVALYGITVWMLLAPVLFGLFYMVLIGPLRRLASRLPRRRSAAT